MADELKEFQKRFSKFRDLEKSDLKNADALVKRVKFFRHDMLTGLDLLEDVVLEAKAGADAIKATKIEDYGDTNKEVRELLKAIKPIDQKLTKACNELDQLPNLSKIINANSKKLKVLKKDIETDLKKRDKKCKLRPGIAKLLEQVDEDIKISDEIIKTVKEIPKEYYEADNLYKTKIRAIMVAKPRISAKTKKYMALAPTMLKRSVLQKTTRDCQKKADRVKSLTELAAKAVEENKSKNGIKHWQEATKVQKELNKTIESYLVIKKKHGDQIEKSVDKKQIETAMSFFEKLQGEIEKQWTEAENKINKKKA